MVVLNAWAWPDIVKMVDLHVHADSGNLSFDIRREVQEDQGDPEQRYNEVLDCLVVPVVDTVEDTAVDAVVDNHQMVDIPY